MESGSSERAAIVVKRDAEKDIKMRSLDVYVDDQFSVDLTYPGEYRAEVDPGDHSVKVSNRLYSRSLRVPLKAGETVTVEAGNYVTGVGTVMMSVLGMGPYKVFLREVGRTGG